MGITIALAPRMVSFDLVKAFRKVTFVDFQQREKCFWFLNGNCRLKIWKLWTTKIWNYEPPWNANHGFHGNKVVSRDSFLDKLSSFSDFWLGIPFQKSKILFLLWKVNTNNFFWKLIKTKSNYTILVAIEIVLPNLMLLKHEKEVWSKFVTRTPSSWTTSPKINDRLHFGHSSWK